MFLGPNNPFSNMQPMSLFFQFFIVFKDTDAEKLSSQQYFNIKQAKKIVH